MFEGDIVLPPGRNGVPHHSQRWTDGIIPYVIDSSAQYAKDTIEKAIDYYTDNTCIRFTPRTNEKDYVRFIKGSGCYSYVGRIRSRQDLSIGQGCNDINTVLHEMMHAIGFRHEQCRSDRDGYVVVHYENIDSNQVHNFDRLEPDENVLYTQFDFDSIMLYGPTYFSKNGQVTLSSKVSGKQVKDQLHTQVLSKLDLEKINKLYDCVEG